MKALTLLELNWMVRNGLRDMFPETYWVLAEVSECKENYSGHCYLELIQKKEGQDLICAKSRATIWAKTWAELGPYFEKQTGSKLRTGHKVLVEVSVEFHELYGMNLVIRNIDPSYTIGDQALRRQQIIKQLETDGVIDQNKELELPVLPQRVAVISSLSAAGYQDFMHQLNDNGYGFVFYTVIFPAIMQGEASAQSIINALDRVVESGVAFDVVVIIRGGGAAADLSCFDQYDLCYYCTQFPLPILTGLGHDKDYSVLDRVANTSVKTPTAAAEFLVDSLLQQSFRLENNADLFVKRTNQVMESNKLRLQTLPVRLQSFVRERIYGESMQSERFMSLIQRVSEQILLRSRQRTEMAADNLVARTNAILEQKKYKLELTEKSVMSFSADAMLTRGFSITLSEGRIVRSVSDVRPGSRLETRFGDGTIQSITEIIHKNDE